MGDTHLVSVADSRRATKELSRARAETQTVQDDYKDMLLTVLRQRHTRTDITRSCITAHDGLVHVLKSTAAGDRAPKEQRVSNRKQAACTPRLRKRWRTPARVGHMY